ncbi:MAG TPA: PDZ domain-containing protein [Candidatus Krumholzibacteria bacterium]|nr:PDZ domain-containing protein [Candidatus Krumholzibacteria bacterium]
MNRMIRHAALSVLCLFVSASAAHAQVDARMLQNPDVSKTQIVFSYAGDLWVVPKTGGTALKLSSPPGQELFPHFSPDGTRIAYSANYNGNYDVFTIASGGGIPTRVTYHGMTDRIIDWYPDGKNLLFASSMESGRQRYNQFYKVSPDGGLPEVLTAPPFGEYAAVSPDGKMIAYTPESVAFRTWKRYRGGWAPDIYLFDVAKNTAENITKNDANDEFPMWAGRKLYFLSDRDQNQRSNIWVYDLDSKQSKEVTNFADYDIHLPAIGPDDIVFEAGGELYRMSLADEKYAPVKVQVTTDEMTLMPRDVNAADLLSSIGLAPDGKRGVFTARGDVFSVPAEHGTVLDLTNTPGAAERYAAWSPDARSIAYWSDASGEYELYVRDLASNKEKKITSFGPGYRYRLFWSPDSKKIAFIDKAMQIKVVTVADGKSQDADKELYYYQDGLDQFVPSWSPDSRWLAYRRDLRNANGAIALFDTKEGKSRLVTSGFYNDNLPTFDPDGKYLYFLTNRTLEPIYSDIDGTWIYANTTGIAVASLTADTPLPTFPQNDSTKVATPGDKGGDDKADKKDDKKSKDKDKDKDKKKEEKPKETKITLDGFEDRVAMLPVKPGNFANLVAISGKVVFHRNANTGSGETDRPIGYYDLEKREEKNVTGNSDIFAVSADGKKILIGKDHDFAVVDIAEDQKMDKKMPAGTLTMNVDPRAEWKQIFNDTWRFERDFFYDPNMHGVDWNAMKTRYGKLLDNAVTRWDVNFVIGELISELSSSHTYRGGGDVEESRDVAVGYLGCDWALDNGAYRVKKIIDGAPWDTEVRSPLAAPGVNVKEGDYILAVNGRPIDVKKAPWAAFAGLSKETVTLTVNSKASMDGAHDVLVQTLDDETRLRHLAWIESNRKRVDELSGGKIGYVYVPSTGLDGQTELVRQFTAQFNKEGLVIDERFNSGGQIPDRFIELLNRKPLAFWAVRDGTDWQFPQVANFGPKAMLINGWSGSGGDAFPDYFRKAGLGPLVGERTWGGLIGISGSPDLIDGGNVTVPTFRMYNPDGTWFKEGHGVDPDVEVPEDYAALAKGTDVQLERGVQEVMKQIQAKGSPYPKRPAYEKR